MSVPKGIGTDIIEVVRIQKAFDRHGERFLEKILTENERQYCAQYKTPWPQLAGRFAAKEAVLKALGTGLVGEMTWHEIEILNNSLGKPEVFLSKRLTQLYPKAHFLISISHCETYATATALLVEAT